MSNVLLFFDDFSGMVLYQSCDQFFFVYALLVALLTDVTSHEVDFQKEAPTASQSCDKRDARASWNGALRSPPYPTVGHPEYT